LVLAAFLALREVMGHRDLSVAQGSLAQAEIKVLRVLQEVPDLWDLQGTLDQQELQDQADLLVLPVLLDLTDHPGHRVPPETSDQWVPLGLQVLPVMSDCPE